MITYFDLINDDNFRSYVEKRIQTGAEAPMYVFSKSFPSLYKYRPFSKFAIDDVINGKISASSIGEFNDLFDGAFHHFGTEKEREEFAEKEWQKYESLGTSEGPITRDLIVGLNREHFKIESRLKFRELEYLGTYVSCLSSKCDSTLMWSHYADSNKGICIEYDFNEPSTNSTLNKFLFPVAYSKKPIYLTDLLLDEKREIYEFPLDAAVLCAALNKADAWRYEHEWRMVFVLSLIYEGKRRLSLKATPSSIILGNHFLKNFFYYDYKNQSEREATKSKLKDALRLLDHAEHNALPVFVMVPYIGEYGWIKVRIEVSLLRNLLNTHFDEDCPEDMRYYYVVHDELMDILEKQAIIA